MSSKGGGTGVARDLKVSSYVRAIMSLGLKRDVLARLVSEVRACADEWEFLSTPSTFAKGVIEKIEASDFCKRLLLVVNAHGNLLLLPDVARLLTLEFCKEFKLTPITYTSSAPISSEEMEGISSALHKKIETDIVLIFNINTSLIYGFTLRVGPYYADCSARGFCNSIKSLTL